MLAERPAVVWYMVDCTGGRITDADVRFCSMFRTPHGTALPIVVLLNKADAAAPDAIARLKVRGLERGGGGIIETGHSRMNGITPNSPQSGIQTINNNHP